MVKALEVNSTRKITYRSRRTQNLRQIIVSYLEKDDCKFVLLAMDFAIQAHYGQKRLSGKPYIEHPLATAIALAEMKQDAATVASALLHDVVEDCNVTFEDLEHRFSPTVRKLVQGVTNLNQLDYSHIETQQKRAKKPPSAKNFMPNTQFGGRTAYNLRKMFIAMAQDVRVVLLKLADRLHNMNTLRHLPPERQLRMARETMDIYAPIANRLGISLFKWQLEDISFKYLMPEEYRRVSRIVSRRRTEREDYTKRAHEQILKSLQKTRIKCVISSRPKHLYSIYRKINRYTSIGRRYNEIYDFVALRIIVENDRLDECYRVLEVVHGLWKPLPNQFDDYIANPKQNLYRSLHTSVIGPDNFPLEIQIRTREMHRIAEDGVAAHWAYKEGGKQPHRASDVMYEKAIADLKRHLIEGNDDDKGAGEYVETVRRDYLSGQIFVFTPRGDVIELPTGSTPLDFAYKVHTELGHRCRGSKVNGRLVSLNHQLNSGNIVEIVRSNSPQAPKLDWLNPHLGFLKSDSARNKVKAWFRQQNRRKNITRGHTILEQERKRLSIKDTNAEIAQKLNYAKTQDLENALGSGQINIEQVLEYIIPEVFGQTLPSKGTQVKPIKPSDIVVMGTKGLYSRISRCCSDLQYGEAILGYLTRGNGVSIHRSRCRNVQLVAEPMRLVNATWGHSPNTYPTTLSLLGQNRIGLIRDITTILAEEGANVGSMHTNDNQNKPDVEIGITLYAINIQKLTTIIRRIRNIQGIIKISNNPTKISATDTNADNIKKVGDRHTES